VMDVPPAPYANTHSLQVYHASFGDFLRDQRRSGRFYAKEDKTHGDVAIHSLRWLGHVIKSECGLADSMCRSACGLPLLKWATPTGVEPASFSSSRIGEFAATTCWRACNLAPEEDAQAIVAELREFDFCHLTSVDDIESFTGFINRLYDWDRRYGFGGIVRLDGRSRGDSDLLSKINELKNKFVIGQASLPLKSIHGWSFSFVSSHSESRYVVSPSLRVLLLGFGWRTVLVILCSRRDGQGLHQERLLRGSS